MTPDAPLRWRVTLRDGAIVIVETHANPPFENAAGGVTHGIVCRGATAVIMSCGALEPAVRKQSCANFIPGVPTPAAVHEQAVAYLAGANGWKGATIEQE